MLTTLKIDDISEKSQITHILPNQLKLKMSSFSVQIPRDIDCDIEYYDENTDTNRYVTIRSVGGSRTNVIMRGRYTYNIVYSDFYRRYVLASTTNPNIYTKQ
jgi:hypothetical protein